MPRQSESTLAAIKQAVDIVALVGEYLPLRRAGANFVALCPFHDDHNPSLNVNPERQSFKCWACGAGGDIFDFVKSYEKVDFPEALRMLAVRAGIPLESSARPAPEGPSKTELLEVTAWAQRLFAEALAGASHALAYVSGRGISDESAQRFCLGYAPEAPRDWLVSQARLAGIGLDLLEQTGLVVQEPETGAVRARFRGRLIFPIHDVRGQVLGFGGRILPAMEKRMAELGKAAAKYLNSPETPLFQKRKVLYAADLARSAARQAGWVAVMEGYTDVIAAHQAGLANVVGTLGTALGDDHVRTLRGLADRVVLVFDGDEAGQAAADRSLELFLGHEVDVRVLTLPEGLDPCDFLLKEGADAFRSLADQAVDPLSFAIHRAQARFDFGSAEGARLAAEWVLGIIARIPRSNRLGLDLKVAKALDTLSQRLGVPVDDLKRGLHRLRQRASRKAPAQAPEPAPERPIALGDLDPTDRELVRIVLSDSTVLDRLHSEGITPDLLREEPLRTILQASFDLYGEGLPASFNRVSLRLDDNPRIKALAVALVSPIEIAPLPEAARPAPAAESLPRLLAALKGRARQDRLRELKGSLDQVDPIANPETYNLLMLEYLRLLPARPDLKAT